MKEFAILVATLDPVWPIFPSFCPSLTLIFTPSFLLINKAHFSLSERGYLILNYGEKKFQTVKGFFFFLIISYVQIQILGWLNFYILIFRIFSYTYTLSKQGVLTGSVSWKVQCWPLMWSAGILRIRAQHCVSLGERRLQRRPQLSSLSYGPWETDLTLLKFPCWQVWWTWHWGY